MPFCRFCGKEINEGETCTCAQAQAEANKTSASNAEAVAAATDALKDAAKAGGEVAGKAGVTCLEIIKKPVTEGVEFINGSNYITAIAVIILQSLLTAVFSLVIALKFNGALKGLIKVSVVKPFFMSILFSLVATLLFTAITFLTLKLLKLEVSLYQSLEIAGVRASLLSGGIAVAALLSLINIGWGLVVFVFAGILVFIEVYAVLNKKYEGASNKLVYGIIVSALVFVLVACFAFSKTYTWLLPKDMKSLWSLIKYFQ
ncbi:MAG: hypothetical protein J5717_12460 [Lachnospiraceae bacterium]|nr:hypothetical protein [Lachnospiraceae bacterium]